MRTVNLYRRRSSGKKILMLIKDFNCEALRARILFAEVRSNMKLHRNPNGRNNDARLRRILE